MGAELYPEVIEDHFARPYPLALTIVDYQHTNPVHVVNANLGWSRGPWEMDGYLRYESRFSGMQGGNLFDPVGSLVRIPDYVSVDARIAYRITDNLTLAISGQNLLQSPQKQTSAPESSAAYSLRQRRFPITHPKIYLLQLVDPIGTQGTEFRRFRARN